MNTERLKNYKGETIVVDNNILTDFMEITAALSYDYISLFNQLFEKVKIPTPVLEDENIYEDLGSLKFIEGTIETELGFNIFIELRDSENSIAKRLSEYDRIVIAIAGEGDLLAVSNDKPVRDICKNYDIKVTGTLGIMISAYENKIIEFSQLKECLEFLFSDDSSCYLSHNLKNKIYSNYKI
jgi:predicted nucleic acid-binding protein